MNGAERDELGQVLAEAGEGGAAEEEHHEQEEGAAAVAVGPRAVDRYRDGRGEPVAGEDPRVVPDPARFDDHPRHWGADDRLAERSDQHSEHNAEKDQQQAEEA